MTTKTKDVPVTSGKTEAGGLPARPRAVMDPFEEMDRLFDRMMGNFPLGGWLRPTRRNWPAQLGLETHMPPMDVIERDNEILVRAELPGVKKDDVEVSLNDRSITVRGKVEHSEKTEEGDYYCAETRRGEFARTMPLPAEVDGARAEAHYRDGVIEITLPKREAAKRHHVEIHSD